MPINDLTCACGCGAAVSEGRTFVQGHNSRRTVVMASNPNVDRHPRDHHHSERQGARCWSPPYAEPWAQQFRANGGKLAFWKSGEVDAKFPDGRRQHFGTWDEAEQALGGNA